MKERAHVHTAQTGFKTDLSVSKAYNPPTTPNCRGSCACSWDKSPSILFLADKNHNQASSLQGQKQLFTKGSVLCY